jgi:hypothetical protein
MLVWTDAPGHGLGGNTPAWNNNLDLIVEHDGGIYYGNRFGADGWSIPNGDPDVMNNTEGVFLGPSVSGTFTVRVRATDLNSDGVPGFGDDTDQDFSLVAYNAVGDCVPDAGFTGDLELVELETLGAQGLRISWSDGTASCGGELSYSVYRSNLGPGSQLVRTTTANSVDLYGLAPGIEYCFEVQVSEDGVAGETSTPACFTGSAARTAGDLDCDLAVGTVDLSLLVGVIFGAPEPLCGGFATSDVNLDGATDTADLASEVQYLSDPL